MPELSTMWRSDCAVLSPGASPHAVQAVGADLLRRWTEPARRYHTTTHLMEMFRALQDLHAAAEVDGRQALVARVAAWFHDAVYDPHDAAGDNEVASAELAGAVLPALGFAADDVSAVEELIRLTTDHAARASPAARSEAAFADADLWILSAQTRRFDAYCAQVRQEYAHVPDRAYRQARTAVLSPFVERDFVYATAHGRAHWEEGARRNVRRELDRLARPL